MTQENDPESRDNIFLWLSELPEESLSAASSERIRRHAQASLRNLARRRVPEARWEQSWSWLFQPAVAFALGVIYLAWAFEQVAALVTGTVAILHP
ncbi:MAG TPA: hypothetical protein VLR94_08830 [Acidobacteriota bacterium]|nr:hypothetical protein [Acidobacteriota bacterium]